MRILIGNHIEDSILKLKSDNRIFSQRILWFAEDGDIIILSTEPDNDFLQHVASLTGVNPNSLSFYVLPKGKYFGKHFDPQGLTNKLFLEHLSRDLEGKNISEIIPIWPSPTIARFAEELGLSDRLPGINFFLQNGVELANNKAYFRALAAAANIPIARGEVCLEIKEAEIAMERLLNTTGAVMVKQVHNGAGAGNELVIQDHTLEVNHVGAKYVHHLESDSYAIKKYLDERWRWASIDDGRPVVIEQFKPNSQTIYAEFHIKDSGVFHTQAGRLGYTSQRLTEEIAPLRGISRDIYLKLVMYGERLAKIYHGIGYRGYLSADAIIDKNGELTFTEVNARVSGSLHIYDSIGRRVVETTRVPERTVVQYHSPLHWVSVDFNEFLTATEELGCLYDPEARKGVLISLPILQEVGGFVSFCIVYENENEVQETYKKLDAKFSR